MKLNKDIINNTVEAENQVNEKCKFFINDKKAKKVLFVGNSITLHEKAPQIGWNYNWGMAASTEQNDYVHIVLAYLQSKFGNVNYCICNVGKWELNYTDENVIYEFENVKKFKPDLIIVRFGENVKSERFDKNVFANKFEKFINYLKCDNSKLLVTNLFWQNELIDDSIFDVCKKNNYAFVSLTDLGYDDTNKALGCFAHNGVCLHPNDKGMKNIADRIISKMEEEIKLDLLW